MLVRLIVRDAQNRLLLIRNGREAFRLPSVSWSATGHRLHKLAEGRLKELFQGWHGGMVNLKLTVHSVKRTGMLATVTLSESATKHLPEMVRCCGGMVLAWPEEIEAGFVVVGDTSVEIADAFLLSELSSVSAV